MKTFIYSFIFLTSLLGFSQKATNLEVSVSDEFDSYYTSTQVLSIHTYPNDSTIVIRNGKGKLLVDIFNKDFKKIKNVNIPYQKNESFYGKLSYGNTVKIFTIVSSGKTGMVYCHEFGLINGFYRKTRLLDVEAGKEKKFEVKFFENEIKRSQRILSQLNRREINFAISPNGKYFVISTDNIKKDSSSYTAYVFKYESLELAYKMTYQKHTEKIYEPKDLSIDNDGNVFSLGKLYLDKKAKRKDDRYSFILNKIVESNIMTSNVMIERNKYINTLTISNLNNNMRLLGFYSNQREGEVKGALFYDVNDLNSEEEVFNKSLELPDDIFANLYNSTFGNDNELANFYVDYVLNDDFGNTYLLAEEFFITMQMVTTGGFGSGTTGGFGNGMQAVPNYNNLLVLKINNKGELVWGKSIYKRSSERSYNAFFKNGNLHVLLNSGKRLSSNEANSKVKLYKGILESTALFDIVIDGDGNMEYNKIQDNKRKNTFVPHNGVFMKGRFVLATKNGNKQLLILQ